MHQNSYLNLRNAYFDCKRKILRCWDAMLRIRTCSEPSTLGETLRSMVLGGFLSFSWSRVSQIEVRWKVMLICGCSMPSEAW